jgi:DNA-binding transcriptional ArsR family regulator
LADLLEAVWHRLVEPYWPRLRTLLEADLLFHARRLAQGGLEALFSELHPRLAWTPPTLTLTTRAGWEERRPLDGQGLVLLPSLFCWPDLVSGVEAPWQPTLAYPARGIGSLWTSETGPAPGGATPAPLTRLLGRNRAAVLCALTEPASTSALALRLGLAPSSVSDHLSALRDAGLLVSHRYGHQVLYERTPLGIALASGTGS